MPLGLFVCSRHDAPGKRARQDTFSLVAIQSQPYCEVITARLRGNMGEIGAQYG